MTDIPSSPARAPAPEGFLRQLFTERDNQTADLKRVLWAAGFVWAISIESWLVIWRGQAFDLVNAALGLSGLLAAGGGVLALNRKNENGADAP